MLYSGKSVKDARGAAERGIFGNRPQAEGGGGLFKCGLSGAKAGLGEGKIKFHIAIFRYSIYNKCS